MSELIEIARKLASWANDNPERRALGDLKRYFEIASELAPEDCDVKAHKTAFEKKLALQEMTKLKGALLYEAVICFHMDCYNAGDDVWNNKEKQLVSAGIKLNEIEQSILSLMSLCRLARGKNCWAKEKISEHFSTIKDMVLYLKRDTDMDETSRAILTQFVAQEEAKYTTMETSLRQRLNPLHH